MTQASHDAAPAAGAAGAHEAGEREPRPGQPEARPDPVDGVATTRAVLDDHPPTDGERRYLNRELTWLSFNERVLALAERSDVPLLERAMFLAIFGSNLDEFFQVRVAGLMEQVAAGRTAPPPDGMRPGEQLTAIRDYAGDLSRRQAAIFHEQVAPALADHGIVVADWSSLDDADRAFLLATFDDNVFPVLTPLAVDPAHPFPYISDLSLNLAVVVRDPIDDGLRFARVKVPPILPRFVAMPDGQRFVPLEQVIGAHLDRLFPGLEVVDHHAFRVTRNADFEIEEDEADDLMMAIESELNRRRFGRVVRLEVEPDLPDGVLALLLREMDLAPRQVDRVPGPLDLTALAQLHDIGRADLKYAPLVPALPRALAGPGRELFEAVATRDLLVHHPYESFADTVQAFVEQAAVDPDVLAIKITLYRTSGPGSPIVQALIRAAEAGKQVAVLVELKARFDEERNIEWARVLEEVGAHVAYGVPGLKTHTKIALVLRQEGDRIARYAHVGTGNYNEQTARRYEDVGLLTTDPEIGADLAELFNAMTGHGDDRAGHRRLVTAPTHFRRTILELVAREAAADDGRIVMKVNSLVDAEITDAMYAASAAGTSIDLVVRGICGLRAGVPGMSDNIRVRSIVGRHLEHSRIYAFGSPQRGVDVLIGSGDLMPRNLDRRVEAFVPILDPGHRRRLLDLLDLLLADDVLAWQQHPDGSWSRVPTQRGFDVQHHLQVLAHERAAGR